MRPIRGKVAPSSAHISKEAKDTEKQEEKSITI